ncbi:hypothetical protein GCM10010365_58480 [Streptomyces poonensis]|uniref:Uncharacterized protein n=1 Tax=Streptomyces poonensis TaxID=68255 RepID=A0A918Q2M0_9ACTN|nr:hypothetical protein GCM10010365_58480 [Streptomyces poonensis]
MDDGGSATTGPVAPRPSAGRPSGAGRVALPPEERAALSPEEGTATAGGRNIGPRASLVTTGA